MLYNLLNIQYVNVYSTVVVAVSHEVPLISIRYDTASKNPIHLFHPVV